MLAHMKPVSFAIVAVLLTGAARVAWADETGQPTPPDRGSPSLFGLGLGVATVGLANIPTGILIMTGGAQDVGHAMHTHSLHSADERVPIGLGVVVGSAVLLAAGTALGIVTAPRAGTTAPTATPPRTGLVPRAPMLAYAF